MEFINSTRQTKLATKAKLADSFLSRMRGLLFKKPLETNEGLCLKPCSQIHTFFMKYAIDALFVDKDGLVVGIVENIKPGQISPYFSHVTYCLELPAGTILQSNTQIGDKIICSDNS